MSFLFIRNTNQLHWWGFLWQASKWRNLNLISFDQRWSLMVKGRYGMMKLEYKWCLWRWLWWWWWWSWSLDISDVGRAISGQEGVLKGASPTPIVLPIEQYALHIWHIVAYIAHMAYCPCCIYTTLLPIQHAILHNCMWRFAHCICLQNTYINIS